MNEISNFMSSDHDRLDEIFKSFRILKNQDVKQANLLFSSFKSGLETHIVWEEEILFPIFERRTGMRDSGPTFVMRAEHRQIKGYLQKIHALISVGDVKTDEFEAGLVEVLTAHNNKEESILYPWIDNSVRDDEKLESLRKMKNTSSQS
jgi:iron-sulfur cluster repair protein YtfE (RIC family)